MVSTPEIVDSVNAIILVDSDTITVLSEQLKITVSTARKIEHYDHLFKGLIFPGFHLDNLRPHTAARTMEIVT